ncbi:hypothetical protein OH77DRAFT_854162 [Trametes cingulata]|nr:hypothetical protein OH77DRAFT_854162 [Trametes cingulata]
MRLMTRGALRLASQPLHSFDPLTCLLASGEISRLSSGRCDVALHENAERVATMLPEVFACRRTVLTHRLYADHLQEPSSLDIPRLASAQSLEPCNAAGEIEYRRTEADSRELNASLQCTRGVYRIPYHRRHSTWPLVNSPYHASGRGLLYSKF